MIYSYWLNRKPYTDKKVAWKCNGVLVKEKIKCGKRACKCSKPRGAKHGHYYYLYWREGARRHKRYIKKHNVKSIRRQLREGHSWLLKRKQEDARRRLVLEIAKTDIRPYMAGHNAGFNRGMRALFYFWQGLKAQRIRNTGYFYMPTKDYTTQLNICRWWIDRADRW